MKWISVKERLPKIQPGRDSSERVLITKRLKSRPDKLIIGIGYLTRQESGCFGIEYYWTWIGGTLPAVIVTHWMPLPDPPEIEENERCTE